MCPLPVHSVLTYQCTVILSVTTQTDLKLLFKQTPCSIYVQTSPFPSKPLWKLCVKHSWCKWYHICLKLLNFNYLFAIFQPEMLKHFVPLHQCRIYGSLKTWEKMQRFWARGDALLTDLLGSSKHIHSLHGRSILYTAVPLVPLNQPNLAQ